MTAPADTAALLTPPGPAGLALVRLRGPRVPEALARFTPGALRQPTIGAAAWRATLRDHDGAALDDVVVSILSKEPEWDAIWHLHGSPAIAARCLEMLSELGFSRARDPAAGFFVAQDIIEAEALAVLPRIRTDAGVRWLLESVTRLRAELRRIAALPTDDAARAALAALPRDQTRRLTAYCTPLRVALLGPPNAGKSSLINALADRSVSIVAPTPGTTRDWIEAEGELDGYPVTWIDTAGIRSTDHPLEADGVSRALRIAGEADAALVVLDGSLDGATARREFVAQPADLQPMLIALNKSDAPGFDLAAFRRELPPGWRTPVVPVSALARWNLDDLARAILRCAKRLPACDVPGPITDNLVLYFQSLTGSGSSLPAPLGTRAILAALSGDARC